MKKELLTGLATAWTMAFLFLIDANPSLWMYDKLMVSPKRIRNKFGGNSMIENQHPKRVWITGASAGIGAELAIQLASACQEGITIIISARSKDKLQHVAECCGGNANVQVVPMNVDCSQSELERIIKEIGPVDCVILNAGIGQQSLADEVSREETEQVFRINTFAPIHITQTLLRQPNPPSHFVVTSSVVAKCPAPLSTSYAASKHAVQGYFASLLVENPNLRIDLPCPGPVATAIFGTTSDPKERKMTPARCARLIIAAMLKPSGGETWIAQQPTLIFFYLQQYFPTFTLWLLQNVLAPTRVALFKNNLSLFDPASLGKLRALKKEAARRELVSREHKTVTPKDAVSTPAVSIERVESTTTYYSY
jgi:dehydrogenase/reductase SDR family protein 7